MSVNDVFAIIMLVMGVLTGLFFQFIVIRSVWQAFEPLRILITLKRYFRQYHQWDMGNPEIYKLSKGGWEIAFHHLPENVNSNVIGDMTKKHCVVDGKYIVLADIPKPERKPRETSQEAVPNASRQLA